MLREEPIEKLNIRVEEDYLQYEPELIAKMNEFPDAEACQQGIGMMELTSKDANKGEAVAEMANRLGIDCSEVMAIGDNDNDVSMLTFAGTGVAMGQAYDSVKEEADYVTDTNDDLGVAKAITKFILDEPQDDEEFSEELVERVKRANRGVPVVYCKKGCTTCKKALDWLKENHVEFTEREITEVRPSERDFLKYFKESTLPERRFFNTRGVLFKKMDLKDRLDTLSEEEKAELLAQNGMLIKRPLLVYRGEVYPGFNKKEWSKILKING